MLVNAQAVLVGAFAAMGFTAGLLLVRLLRPWSVGLSRPAQVIALATYLGMLSTLIASRFAGDPALPAWWWLAITGVALSLIDLACHRLPHTWVLAMAGGGLAVFTTVTATTEPTGTAMVRSLLAALVVFGTGIVVFLLIPNWMGFGDITTNAALASYWGWIGWHTVLIGLVSSILLLGITSALTWIRLRDAAARIAAGPSLILGSWIGILLHTS
ncbi:prepilin peptidase [Saccharopolyspora sp. ASAGF58]|uniref:prepilin peptidase n=1 Tax=Saccharopolyspora sp. ASAGF58 TaxID=2719023 RepID=UPI00143FC121|nr:prepilin peptidase [Saccharopolyspora sp. ASAGF58]QIZ37910.1 hypothetical protein FDZ84_29280 [Saccharopolyspora sp. ASAGF58]